MDRAKNLAKRVFPFVAAWRPCFWRVVYAWARLASQLVKLALMAGVLLVNATFVKQLTYANLTNWTLKVGS